MVDVLIVEDEEETCAALRSVLNEAGYSVAEVGDGWTALEYLRRNPAPTLILLDLLLPEMYGFEFRDRQLENPQLAGIPVVVMSVVVKQFELGDRLQAAAYLSKPVQERELLTVVGQLCPGRSEALGQ